MRTRERRDWLLRRLREGGARRAEDLAAEIGASPRTIYRDMAALRASGLPVMGERGLGYLATAPMMLPAMTLEAEEAAALGEALTRLADTDDPLARAAGSRQGGKAARGRFSRAGQVFGGALRFAEPPDRNLS